MKHLVADEFNKLIDHELSPQETEAAQKHLAECAVCSNELKSFQSVQSLLKDQQPESASEKIESAVMTRIVRRIKNEKSQKTFFSFIISLFGFGILVILGFVGYKAAQTVLSLPEEHEAVQLLNNTAAQIQSFIHPLFGEKNLQSFEVTMILFFALSIYFLVEKFKAIRN